MITYISYVLVGILHPGQYSWALLHLRVCTAVPVCCGLTIRYPIVLMFAPNSFWYPNNSYSLINPLVLVACLLPYGMCPAVHTDSVPLTLQVQLKPHHHHDTGR